MVARATCERDAHADASSTLRPAAAHTAVSSSVHWAREAMWNGPMGEGW